MSVAAVPHSDAAPDFVSFAPASSGWWVVRVQYNKDGSLHHSRAAVAGWRTMADADGAFTEALVAGDGGVLVPLDADGDGYLYADAELPRCHCITIGEAREDPSWCPGCGGVLRDD